MLVLGRKINESIVLPQFGIRITVCSVSNTKNVKIGIEAPKDITILREEVFIEICSQKTEQNADGREVEEANP